MKEKRKILLVEEDPVMVKVLGMGLADQDFDILSADNGKAALKIIAKENPGLIVADLPEEEMILLTSQIKSKFAGSKLIVVLDGKQKELKKILSGHGVQYFFDKEKSHLKNLVKEIKKLI